MGHRRKLQWNGLRILIFPYVSYCSSMRDRPIFPFPGVVLPSVTHAVVPMQFFYVSDIIFPSTTCDCFCCIVRCKNIRNFVKRVDRQVAEILTRVPPTCYKILIHDGGAVTSLYNAGSKQRHFLPSCILNSFNKVSFARKGRTTLFVFQKLYFLLSEPRYEWLSRKGKSWTLMFVSIAFFSSPRIQFMIVIEASQTHK